MPNAHVYCARLSQRPSTRLPQSTHRLWSRTPVIELPMNVSACYPTTTDRSAELKVRMMDEILHRVEKVSKAIVKLNVKSLLYTLIETISNRDSLKIWKGD